MNPILTKGCHIKSQRPFGRTAQRGRHRRPATDPARGVVEPGRVCESPYDGVAPEAIFVESDLDRIFEVIEQLARSAQ